MTPKYGERNMHGEARLFFQSGALQNTNVTPRDRTFDIFQPTSVGNISFGVVRRFPGRSKKRRGPTLLQSPAAH
jgi:hypothetical protein